MKDTYSQSNDRITYMTSERRCLDTLDEKGFTDQYQVKKKKLFCLSSGRSYTPEQFKVVNFYRFEGPSNPDDMSVIYAIETDDGRRGFLVDAFGLYADNDTGELMKQVEDIQKITQRGWV